MQIGPEKSLTYVSSSALKMSRKNKKMLPANAKPINFQASFWRMIKKSNRRKLKVWFGKTIKSDAEEHLTSVFLLALVIKCHYLNTGRRHGCKGPPIYKTLELAHQTRIVQAMEGNSFKRCVG